MGSDEKVEQKWFNQSSSSLDCNSDRFVLRSRSAGKGSPVRLQWSLSLASSFLTVPGPTPVNSSNDAGCWYVIGHLANELAA